MKIILARLLIIIFTGLSIIHFYWAFGGKWGFEKAIPTNELGVKVLKPTTLDSAIVAVGLLLIGFSYLLVFSTPKKRWIILIRNIVLWAIPILFLLRAFGDFKYVGFFKQVKTTEFANMDTILYSPLCLIIGLIGIILIKSR